MVLIVHAQQLFNFVQERAGLYITILKARKGCWTWPLYIKKIYLFLFWFFAAFSWRLITTIQGQKFHLSTDCDSMVGLLQKKNTRKCYLARKRVTKIRNAFLLKTDNPCPPFKTFKSVTKTMFKKKFQKRKSITKIECYITTFY